MLPSERSRATFFLAVVAIALLGVSLAVPWFVYSSSTGRKTAPGGPQDPDDLQIERHDARFAAFAVTGDATPTHAAAADAAVQQIGVALAVALGAFALVLLAELPFLWRLMPRW